MVQTDRQSLESEITWDARWRRWWPKAEAPESTSKASEQIGGHRDQTIAKLEQELQRQSNTDRRRSSGSG